MKKTVKRFITTFMVLCSLTLVISCDKKLDAPPNFIIILTDDQGYNDLGCYGSTRVETPNIDRMAEEGIRFTSFYAQNVCGPSRAALLSGCYPIRVGEPGNLKHQHTILHPDEITLVEKLKEAEYATACIGKWHLGLPHKDYDSGYDPATMPNAQGFDYFLGTPQFNGYTVNVEETRFRSSLVRNEKVIKEKIESWDFCTQMYTDSAISWIDKNKNHPFFLYLAHNMPHIPLGAGEKFKGKNPGDPYADAIEEIDWSTGKILDYLKANNLDENTYVIFFSDNGPWIEVTRGNVPGGDEFIPPEHSGDADPLKGYKMLSWEGGHRVPAIAWGPNRIPSGKVIDEIVTSMDLYPTFLKFSNVQPDPEIKRDGKDISSLLLNPKEYSDPGRVFYFYVYTHLQAVRQGKWKLVVPRPEFPEWTGFAGRFAGDNVDNVELYNLETDISETHNVADENTEVVRELMQLIESAKDELGDYNQIGKQVRFYEETKTRPDVDKWKE